MEDERPRARVVFPVPINPDTEISQGLAINLAVPVVIYLGWREDYDMRDDLDCRG
jgi:hypothetical protein